MKLLSPPEYPRVGALLRSVPFNTLFARTVVEGHVSGRVYVDDCRAPRACYVAHRYGMSLLVGSIDSRQFNESLVPYLMGDVPRASRERLQVFPEEWSERLEEMLGPRLTRVRPEDGGTLSDRREVFQNVRVNFRFNVASCARLKRTLVLPDDCEIVDDLDYIYRSMHGSVVPQAFWDAAAQFKGRGAAFALLCGGELASTAFTSFAVDRYLELGVETRENFRGRGFAVHACCALIDYSLDRGLEPVWACRLDNHGSYRLARKLGFDHLLSIPYYELPVRAVPQVQA